MAALLTSTSIHWRLYRMSSPRSGFRGLFPFVVQLAADRLCDTKPQICIVILPVIHLRQWQPAYWSRTRHDPLHRIISNLELFHIIAQAKLDIVDNLFRISTLIGYPGKPMNTGTEAAAVPPYAL